MSEQRACWVCGAAFGEHEYKLVSSAGPRHKDRDICIDILMERLANAEAALRVASRTASHVAKCDACGGTQYLQSDDERMCGCAVAGEDISTGAFDAS